MREFAKWLEELGPLAYIPIIWVIGLAIAYTIARNGQEIVRAIIQTVVAPITAAHLRRVESAIARDQALVIMASRSPQSSQQSDVRRTAERLTVVDARDGEGSEPGSSDPA